jgi:hypothetical protein
MNCSNVHDTRDISGRGTEMPIPTVRSGILNGLEFYRFHRSISLRKRWADLC